MAGNTGTLGLGDLLQQQNVSAEEYGVQTIQEVLLRDNAAYNNAWRPVMSDFIAITTDSQRVSGGSTQGRMQSVNQAGRAPTQRAQSGATVGFPLDKKQYNIGWTQDYFELASPADMAQQTLNAQIAHGQALIVGFKKAIYGSANFNYVDEYVKGITLGVKRFANADGFPIPNGPNYEVFNAASHSHYLAIASPTAAFVTSLIQTVQEHNAGARIMLAINVADQAAISAITGFVPLQYEYLTLNSAANQPVQQRPIGPLNNVMIGRFLNAEVWVKPWAIANYWTALDMNAPEKPVVMRELRPGTADLRVRAQFSAYPLVAQYMESMFDFGVWGRLRGAVGYVAGGTYVDPTITGA